jgi:hypothetical protein
VRGSLHRDLRCFLITDFADENHVGVVAENGPEAASKSQPGFFTDLIWLTPLS